MNKSNYYMLILEICVRRWPKWLVCAMGASIPERSRADRRRSSNRCDSDSNSRARSWRWVRRKNGGANGGASGRCSARRARDLLHRTQARQCPRIAQSLAVAPVAAAAARRRTSISIVVTWEHRVARRAGRRRSATDAGECRDTEANARPPPPPARRCSPRARSARRASNKTPACTGLEQRDRYDYVASLRVD